MIEGRIDRLDITSVLLVDALFGHHLITLLVFVPHIYFNDLVLFPVLKYVVTTVRWVGGKLLEVAVASPIWRFAKSVRIISATTLLKIKFIHIFKL